MSNEVSLRYVYSRHSFEYRFRTSLEWAEEGQSKLYFDASDGRLLTVLAARGQPGNSIENFIKVFHQGRLLSSADFPLLNFVFRTGLTLLGLALVYLCASGLRLFIKRSGPGRNFSRNFSRSSEGRY